ncbi:hypothetical protein AGOR_G00242960 [Albula goreensis]|uniref:Uncharacterized protein n=1 Tax=Albula goreensis TaxID=1534307 RepID=A0A8T3CE00_9TELE|nr:hypothetical protein AGOR_G00242960 [Albula goreensis]
MRGIAWCGRLSWGMDEFLGLELQYYGERTAPGFGVQTQLRRRVPAIKHKIFNFALPTDSTEGDGGRTGCLCSGLKCRCSVRRLKQKHASLPAGSAALELPEFGIRASGGASL